MRILGFIVLAISIFNLMPVQRVEAGSYVCAKNGSPFGWTPEACSVTTRPYYIDQACSYYSQGYSCGDIMIPPDNIDTGCTEYELVCSKLNVDTYSATKLNEYSLSGTKSTENKYLSCAYSPGTLVYSNDSPFLYLHNAPEGNVSVNISSPLDTYFPKPAFNQKNGWNVVSHNGQITLENEKVNNLFYELALKKMTLNRNGRNFASKDEVIAYLNNSDFLTKLGFSEEEKKNSLGYLIPEIQKASDTEYYYLTVLEPESIANISTLTVTPKPNRIDRQYFAVYPTEVPVRTEGDFIFPETDKEDGFTVKETGEFLIKPGMFIFFK